MTVLIVAITAVVTITTIATFTNKSAYSSPYCAGKVAKTAVANPWMYTEVISLDSALNSLLSVANQAAPYRTAKSRIDNTNPTKRKFRLEIVAVIPKKNKENVLTKKAIS